MKCDHKRRMMPLKDEHGYMSPGVLFNSFLKGSPRRGGSRKDFSSEGGTLPAAAAELLPGRGVTQGGAAAVDGYRGAKGVASRMVTKRSFLCHERGLRV